MSADILDIVIIAIILLSTIVGAVMGFVKEALVLATLVASFVIAALYAEALAPELPILKGPDYELARLAIAFGAIFIVALVVGMILTNLLSAAINTMGLGGIDHSLGAAFGLVLGILLVTIVVLLMKPSNFSQMAWWQESRLMPWFESSSDWLNNNIPDNLRRYVDKQLEQ